MASEGKDKDTARLKRKLLERLDVGAGNVLAVARELGINQNTAYGWARKAGRRW